MNTFIVLLPALIIMTTLIGVVIYKVFFNPLKKLVKGLGGKVNARGEGVISLQGRDVYIQYIEGSRNRSPEFKMYTKGLFGALLGIRYENSQDKFYKKIGLNCEPQIVDRDANDKLYFECDDQEFLNRCFLNSKVKQDVFDLLTKFSGVEITPRRCLLKKYPSPPLSTIDQQQLLDLSKQLLDFARLIPPLGGDHSGIVFFRIKRAFLYFLGTVILVSGIVSWMWASGSFRVVDSMRLWVVASNYSIVIGLVMVAFAFILIKGFSTSSRVFIYFAVTFSIGVMLCGRYGTAVINGVYDKSNIEMHQQVVIDKYTTRSKSGTHYHVVVQPWREGVEAWHFTVFSGTYDKIKVGHTYYRIGTRAGFLGFEWVVSEEIDQNEDTFRRERRVYENAIRQKIAQEVGKKYVVEEEGIIYLTFTVSVDGQLIKVDVDQQKTRASDKAIEDALFAIKSASPFGAFPPSLARQHQQFDFSIEIKEDPN